MTECEKLERLAQILIVQAVRITSFGWQIEKPLLRGMQSGMTGFAKVTAKLRETAGKKLRQVADDIETTVARVGAYEAGRATVPFERLPDLAIALGVVPIDLFVVYILDELCQSPDWPGTGNDCCPATSLFTAGRWKELRTEWGDDWIRELGGEWTDKQVEVIVRSLRRTSAVYSLDEPPFTGFESRLTEMWSIRRDLFPGHEVVRTLEKVEEILREFPDDDLIEIVEAKCVEYRAIVPNLQYEDTGQKFDESIRRMVRNQVPMHYLLPLTQRNQDDWNRFTKKFLRAETTERVQARFLTLPGGGFFGAGLLDLAGINGRRGIGIYTLVCSAEEPDQPLRVAVRYYAGAAPGYSRNELLTPDETADIGQKFNELWADKRAFAIDHLQVTQPVRQGDSPLTPMSPSGDKRFGVYLRDLRAQQDKLQAELAQHLRVSQTTMHAYEAGKTAFPIDLITPAAKFLGTPPREMLDAYIRSHLRPSDLPLIEKSNAARSPRSIGGWDSTQERQSTPPLHERFDARLKNLVSLARLRCTLMPLNDVRETFGRAEELLREIYDDELIAVLEYPCLSGEICSFAPDIHYEMTDAFADIIRQHITKRTAYKVILPTSKQSLHDIRAFREQFCNATRFSFRLLEAEVFYQIMIDKDAPDGIATYKTPESGACPFPVAVRYMHRSGSFSKNFLLSQSEAKDIYDLFHEVWDNSLTAEQAEAVFTLREH